MYGPVLFLDYKNIDSNLSVIKINRFFKSRIKNLMHELKWWRSFVILVIRMWKPNIELNFKAPSCENFHRYFEIWKVRLLSHSWMGGRGGTANRSIWQNILTLAFFCLFYLQPKMQHGGNGACMPSFSQFVKKKKDVPGRPMIPSQVPQTTPRS